MCADCGSSQMKQGDKWWHCWVCPRERTKIKHLLLTLLAISDKQDTWFSVDINVLFMLTRFQGWNRTRGWWARRRSNCSLIVFVLKRRTKRIKQPVDNMTNENRLTEEKNNFTTRSAWHFDHAVSIFQKILNFFFKNNLRQSDAGGKICSCCWSTKPEEGNKNLV